MDRAQLRTIAALALAALAGAAGAAPASAAGPASAAAMLEPTSVVAIELGLPADSQAALEAEPKEYVAGTFSIAASDGTPSGIGEFTAPVPVGVRLKGSTGSFEGLDGKAAFKLKFNAFGGTKFLGLKKLTLNNMVQDASMLHEVLAYEAFRAANVAAPRAGYAYVRVNGVDYGLHLNLETLDDVALKRIFGSFGDPQHLYEGGPFVDVTGEDVARFEVDEGEEADRSDLEALAAAADDPAPGFAARLGPVADVEEMTRMWAAERYLGQWDGYSGGNINNYYLLSDPAGVFQMLPWGMDQALRSWWYPFSGYGGRLFTQCLEDEACAAAYVAALKAVERTTTALDLAPRAEALAALLAPWQAREAAESTRARFDPATIAAEVRQVLQFLDRRPRELATWLHSGEDPEEPAPEEPAPEVKPPDPPAERVTAREAETGPPAAVVPSLVARFALDRSLLGRGLLVARPVAPSAGTVSLEASAASGGQRRRACVAMPKAVAAGEVVVSCRLGESVRRRLASRALTLNLRLSLQPAGGGEALTVARRVRLPRQALP